MALLDVRVHNSVKIAESAKINVTERLRIGAGGVIGENCEITGRDVEIGRELWMDQGATIGGGSSLDRLSSFRAGHFLHLGRDVFINTARAVTIGDEVGLGMGTSLYTHGAYLSVLDGFPVAFEPISIGSRVWIPGAIVNPGVVIGDDVVIGVNSLVNGTIQSGSLAAGSPAKVIKEGRYPAPLSDEDRYIFWNKFLRDYPEQKDVPWIDPGEDGGIMVEGTKFNLRRKRIEGQVSDMTERLRNQLRRYGIRFYSSPVNGRYEQWK